MQGATVQDEADYGGNSMVAPLRRVAMARPGGALTGADPEAWHYSESFDPGRVGPNHDELVAIIAAAGASIEWLDDSLIAEAGLADAVFAYDPSFITDAGAILLNMGKDLRKPERAVHEALYASLNIPVIGSIDGDATVEGGDCFWIDSSTLAVGRGFRTNQAGIDQLQAILTPVGVDVLAYDLPYGDGPAACLHLLSVISPLDDHMALVFAPLLPTALHQTLVKHGYTLIEAPKDEFDRSNGLCLNVLALSPGHCVTIGGFDETARRIRAAGVKLETFDGSALCIPCEGGPTCLTRPLLRR